MSGCQPLPILHSRILRTIVPVLLYTLKKRMLLVNLLQGSWLQFCFRKVASARWFLDLAAPEIAARRSAAETEDGALMSLPVEAF